MRHHQHSLAGQRVRLRLATRAPGPLFTGREVVLVDWQDRVTGLPWAPWRNRGPVALRRGYLARIQSAISGSDPDVVVVCTPEDGHQYLVHDSEVCPLALVPSSKEV